VKTDGSYLSASDPRVLVGLGSATSIDSIRVHWPDGGVEEWKTLPTDKYITLTQGTSVKKS
jgi:hypothetical protein